MFKIALTCAVLMGGFFMPYAKAQLPWPVDVEAGSKWFLQDDAGLFFSARTYIPTGVDAFGVQVFAIPEGGIDYQTLQPYAALELNADSEYASFALWGTYRGGVASLSASMRFCVLSDKCGE